MKIDWWNWFCHSLGVMLGSVPTLLIGLFTNLDSFFYTGIAILTIGFFASVATGMMSYLEAPNSKKDENA